MSFFTDLKALLELPDASHDAVVTLIADSVLEDADDFMGIRFQRNENVSEYFDGGKRTYCLAYANVSNVVVYIDEEEYGQTLQGENETYTVYPERGLIKFVSTVVVGPRIVQVTYKGGYLDVDYPKNVRMKLLKQAAYEFRRRRDMGLSAVSYPEGTVNKFSVDEWLDDVRRVLVRHKRFMI